MRTTTAARMKWTSHFVLSQKEITRRINTIFRCWRCGQKLKVGQEIVSLSPRGTSVHPHYFCMPCALDRELLPKEKSQ